METSELLPIHSEGAKQTVSARTLYEYLGMNLAHWKRWSKKNILENGFYKENEDWQGFALMVNGNEVQDFEVSIDFAKEISMMARTEKGNDARKYFIECEKKALVPTMSDAEIVSKALMLVSKQNEQLTLENSELKAEKEINEPKIRAFEKVISTDTIFSLEEIGKNLGVSGRRIKQELIKDGFFNKNGLPAQAFITKHYFVVKSVYVPNINQTKMQSLVTSIGYEALILKYKGKL